ncbi:hypothetical protein V5F79_22100 [Xanthobacter flavus]|uniref:hypothetical protein n=1 Tax=Xanthobacter flavus TaxID=281 RepID=UPI00372C88FA
MPKAVRTFTTVSRRAEDAATFTLMLLKVAILGPGDEPALVTAEPKRPVLTDGAAKVVKEIA